MARTPVDVASLFATETFTDQPLVYRHETRHPLLEIWSVAELCSSSETVEAVAMGSTCHVVCGSERHGTLGASITAGKKSNHIEHAAR